MSGSPTRDDAASGADPNCIVIAGDGPRAEQLRAVAQEHWSVHRLEELHESIRRAAYIECGGDCRHEQLAALRQISAVAGGEDIIISTSPLLAHSEIAASVPNAARIVILAPPWSATSSVCEIIRSRTAGSAAFGLARRLAYCSGWTPLVQFEGGPSAITRLCGAIVIAAWNLAQRTGRPAEVDGVARSLGLHWSPLREVDRIGVARLAGTFDRGGQARGVSSIYATQGRDEPSASFLANCGNDLIEQRDAAGYFLDGAAQAAASLIGDHLTTDRRHLRRLLAAACGRRAARRLSQALSARYPEMISRLPETAPV